MRKLLTIISVICFAVTLTACTNDELLNKKASMPNPWVDCNQDFETAKKVAGFAFPLELQNSQIRAMKDMIEIRYPIDKNRVVYIRKSSELGREVNSHGLLDISGDYSEYPINEEVQLYNCVWFNLRRDKDKIYVANFSAESGLYSINCEGGLTTDEVKQIFKMIEKVETKGLYKNIPS